LIIVVKPAQKRRKTLMMPAEITGLLAGSSDDFDDRYPQQSQSSQQTYNPIYWRDLPYLGAEYWLLFVVAICFNLGNSSDAFLLMRSVEITIPPAFIPVGLIVMNLVFALAAYPLSAIRDRGLKIRLLLAGFLLHVIVYFGIAIVSNSLQIWCLFALYGLHLAIVQGCCSIWSIAP
ncbi:MFS transporter, partial [bacterium]|nr:MFS transporter [bacterium]